jgi:hypothetical protein
MKTHAMQVRSALLAMVALAVAVAAAGCSEATLSARVDGGVRVVLSASSATAAQTATSAMFDDEHDRVLDGIEIVISDLEARSATEQRLEKVSIDLPATVDLLALLESGGQIDLGVGSLAPGIYDQLVIVVSSVTLTAVDGTVVTITPPGGGWTRVVRVEPFEVVEGEVTTVRILIRPTFSFDLGDDIRDLDDDDCHLDFEAETGG